MFAPPLTDKQILARISTYPNWAKNKFFSLRELIFYTASENKLIDMVEETVKWGEPSYTTTKGSTIRLDWKSKNPDYFYIYFNCKTKLISIYFDMYKNLFFFEKNRAILLDKKHPLPKKALKHCFALSLEYHTIKNRL